MTREAPATASIDPAITAIAIRRGCSASDVHLMCSYPECTCTQIPAAIRAAAPLLVAEEREACAELVDAYIGVNPAAWLSNIAAAIRQRGKP